MRDPDLLRRALGGDRTLSDLGQRRLQRFSALVAKWNPSINIIARSTLDDLWSRHILDSMQLFTCARPEHRLWVDIGSGGGFPGIVIAVLAADFLPGLQVSLVESDKRKSVFLSEASRQLGLSTTVHALRTEDLAAQDACVLSARALAPLVDLCGYAARHIRQDGICAFLKGANAGPEITEARKVWSFDLDQRPSITDSRASVLFLKGLKHV